MSKFEKLTLRALALIMRSLIKIGDQDVLREDIVALIFSIEVEIKDE